MQKKIKINNKEINYTLKRRRGSRSVRLAVYPDGAFVVTAPKWYPVYVIKRFLEEKADWIFEKLKNVDFQALADNKKASSAKYKSQKEFARAVINSRLEFFNRVYGFAYKRVSIKDQKTCWGSCSRKKNLNFSYRVATLSEELRDYVVVHELCHLQELNHGHNFWKLVSETVPNHKELRKKLKTQTKL
ncbi:MAG: SprT family zinc-dependent metalloprotease [Parcubacteria group bacterium]